jgi:hypothetical protein
MEKRNEKKPLEEKAKKILAEIDQQRKEAEKRKMNFTAVTKEELYKKLTKKGSPIIICQSWGSTSPGGSVNYSVGINNPDPYLQTTLFAHVFFGPSNMVPDVGIALCSVDTRFPRLTLPKAVGLQMDPDTTEHLSFAIPIPLGIESSNYIGNCFLFKASWHDIGEYLDRGCFVVQVT